MKKIKHLIAVFVIAALMLSIIPAASAASETPENSPVKSIEILENSYVYIENDKSMEISYFPTPTETFYYNPAGLFLGLKLRINFKNGGFVDYSLMEKIQQFIDADGNLDLEKLLAEAEELLSINGTPLEYDVYDQREHPWEVGKYNKFTIGYMGVEIDVPVNIIKSPVKSITVVENPFKYTLGDEYQGGFLEDGHFVYSEIFSYALVRLRIEFEDGTVKYFRPIKDEGFLELDGYGFTIGDEQANAVWDSGDGMYTISYMGKEVAVPVKVISDELKSSSEKFNDVDEGRWYTEYVDYAISYGLFNGVTDNTFEPGGDMNRAMFVQVLANISGVECDKNANSGFSDVPAGKWYTGAVAWAAENKIVNGVSEIEFAPTRSVTREQMCTMLVRYADHLGIPFEKASNYMLFADDSKISNYAKDAVYACREAGIIDGIGNNYFAPKDTATRAQVAKILSVFYNTVIS